MFGTREILGILVPFFVGVVALLSARGRASAIAALAVGLGFVAGCGVALGGVKLPPANQFEWIVPLSLAVAIASAIVEFMRLGRPIRWPLAALAFAAVAWLLLRSQAPAPVIAGLAAAGAIWWALWDEVLARSPRGWAGMVMTGVAGCASLVLMLSDSQRFGQMGLALTGVLAAVWAIAWWLARDVWRGAAMVWAVTIFGLILNGHFWATPGLTRLNAALLLSSPLLAWVGEIPPLKRLGGWKNGAIRVAAVILPVAVAVTLAILEFKRADQSTGSEYY